MKILFIGDSITDGERKRYFAKSLGKGYVKKISKKLGKNASTLFNRGVSGDRVAEVKKRLPRAMEEVSPHMLSLSVGVNDIIHQFKYGKTVSTKEFYSEYSNLIEMALKHQRVRVVVIEPFLLPVKDNSISKTCLPYEKEWRRWRAVFDPKLEAIQQICHENDVPSLPLDHIFSSRCNAQESAYWAVDGIHPTDKGHDLIAESWLRHFFRGESSKGERC